MTNKGYKTANELRSNTVQVNALEQQTKDRTGVEPWRPQCTGGICDEWVFK